MAPRYAIRSLAWVLSALSLLLLARLDARAQGGTWEAYAPLPTARQELATVVLNGKIYVIGGFDDNSNSTAIVEVYNPSTDTWTTASPLPLATNHNSAAVAAGKIYAFGGGANQTYAYDPATNTWTTVAPTHLQHGGTAAVGVIGDKIYVAGGVNGTTSLRALEVYDPAANTWTQREPMSVARNHTAGAVIGGKFYVVAGRGSANAATALEVYDPVTNTWASRAPMPTGRSGVAAAAVNGELWVFGGENPNQLHGEVEAYNPATNTWRKLPSMPVPRHGMWAAVIGNRIYMPGGGVVPGFGATNANDVFIVDRKATFANISSRLKVETGENVLIAGFIVTGTGSKRIVIRGIGPSLPVEGALQDPQLDLFNANGEFVAANNNWQDAPNRQELIDSSLAPSHPSEAAILTRLDPGNHTAIVRGSNETTGIGLVEVYDLESGSDSKPANISTRGFVQTGDDVLIGGLILAGSEATRVVVRAIGPSLQVANPLPNPTLELRDANGGLIAENDDWRSSQEADIRAANLAPSHELESAILRTLSAANYTAIVRGVGNSTGVGLVEAYSLD